MRPLHLLAIAPALLLAACGGGNPPPAPASSAAPAPAATAKAATPAPASDDALKPLFGTWALDPAQCTGPVLKISKAKFEGDKASCDISGYADNADGSYTADMNCGGTAEKVQMRPIFAPTGEGIDLIYLNRNNLASEVLRCEAAAD